MWTSSGCVKCAFNARVCGFCRPLTLLGIPMLARRDIFSYYRLFVDDLIDTLLVGLKLVYLNTGRLGGWTGVGSTWY